MDWKREYNYLMAHFAQLDESNTVTQVIVVHNNELQINDRSWCLPTRWYPDGYLQTLGILTKVGCGELFDPATNLKAAKAIHDYSQETNGNGFKPWGL